ncbi:MAG TPA: FkbM family methyltransferase [Stellaceae bacterium]|nr:FkbM family methyltransferase [Stellaceae bacterium]
MTAPYFRWRVSPTYLAHLFKAVFKQHHKPLIPLFRRIIPEDGVVLDVGAHAGQYTKIFSRLASRGQVYAFEPGSYARSILRVALYLNRRRNVAILPLGLGAREGTEILTLPVKRPGSYGFGLAHFGPNTRWQSVEREAVAITTIDRIVELLELPRLDFIKADIEGWELQLVRGGSRAIRRFRPILLLELNAQALERAGDDLGTAFAAIAELGYRPVVRDPAGSLMPVAEPRNGDIWWFPAESPLLTPATGERG